MSRWRDSMGTVEGGRGLPRAVRALLMLTAAVFIVQGLADTLTDQGFTRWFGLRQAGLLRGQVWQLFTYMFLHGGFFHLLLNMLVLYFLGPETERRLGSRQFTLLYLVSGLLGGLGWLLIENNPWAICIGASGAVFGIIGAFAALFPNQPITVLVFFILPVTLRAWVLASILAIIELTFLMAPHQGGVAYAAHLAGGLAGYLYAGTVSRRLSGQTTSFFESATRPLRRWLQRAFPKSTDEEKLDRILDKIAREGLGSLTRRERSALEKASRSRLQRG